MPPAGRSPGARAAAPRPAPPPAPAAQRRLLRTALTAVWWVVLAVLLVQKGRALEQKITWYLAVDQFGYATFAHDLLRGRVFHEWAPGEALKSRLPPRADVLVQSYVWDRGRIYSRYAPGFPILLAGWLALFGDDSAHYLNPLLFVAVVLLVIALQRRLFHSRWRALMGGALLVLFAGNGFAGSNVNLWGLTLTRDISAHAVALAGLVLLVPWGARRLGPRRAAAAGLALGFTVSIRPDGVLYLVPATLLALVRWRRERARGGALARALAAGVLGVALGVAPSLAFYWAATGNPFRATQSMEAQDFLSETPRPGSAVAMADAGGVKVAYPPQGWHGGTAVPVQGGGLRLANFPRTFEENWQLIQATYGRLFLVLAMWGAYVALALRPIVFLLTVPYAALAVLLYSCWTTPQMRYLIGASVLLPVLVVEGLMGTFDLVRLMARRREEWPPVAFAGGIGVALLLGVVMSLHTSPPAAMASSHVGAFVRAIPWLVPGAAGVGLLVAAGWPRRRAAGFVAPVLGLVLAAAAIAGDTSTLGRRARFQKPEMTYARENLRRLVPPHAVVITTEDVGRPAENIEYYGGIHALYLTDLTRWRLGVRDAAALLLRSGMPPYLFIPFTQPDREQMLAELAEFQVEQAADIPAPQAIGYFVAAPFHRGVRMLLYRISTPGAADRGAPDS